MAGWSGRPFLASPSRVLHSDSSTHGWGGLDAGTGEMVQEYWREKAVLHINVKELQAAVNTVRSLSKSGETVELRVDNQVTYFYLTKGGGRKCPLNAILRPFFQWCMEKKVTVHVKWVPSKECLADPISRWVQDRGDYSLDMSLFQYLKRVFSPHICLETDLFASPGNKKLDSFVARWPHWEARAVDALQCPLEGMGGLYANPPWSVIQKFLPRLRQYPQVQVLMVVPFWVSAIWWPQLIKMKVPGTPCLRITPYEGMFTNCWGESMPPPVGPVLSDLLREILEGKQVQGSTIDDFLARNPSLKRYSSGFQLLWRLLMARGISAQEATLDQVADSIIQLFAFSPAQARNAYSAVLLIPGFGGVRFHPLLNAYKKLWNRNLEKYGSFWDPLPILLRLARTDYASLGVIVPPVWLGLRPPPSPISALRTHLIICCRLLCLYRSSDLANIKRVVSVMGGVPYIKIRRKGQRVFKWERVVSLDSSLQISTFHLIQ